MSELTPGDWKPVIEERSMLNSTAIQTDEAAYVRDSREPSAEKTALKEASIGCGFVNGHGVPKTSAHRECYYASPDVTQTPLLWRRRSRCSRRNIEWKLCANLTTRY